MKSILCTVLGFLFTLTGFAQTTLNNDTLDIKKSSKPQIKIRSHASIRDNQNPLFIIDGVVVKSGYKTFASLKPEDIVSIQVLKDQPETFCYGTAGRNGVILVTTNTADKLIKTSKELAFKVYEVCNKNWNTTQNVYNAIEARAPGVVISQSIINVTPNIRMRGDDSTIVIVDGVRYDASILNTLNPSDIESVKVSHSPLAQNYFINQ
ncbi:MAG: TonB-dependent receptor plug domain-containing protein [Maribacter sp.]